MRTPFLLLAISIISFNSSSLLVNGNDIQLSHEIKKAYTPDDRKKLNGFIEMKNGDYSLDGKSSVSDEISKTGKVDPFVLNAGLSTMNSGGIDLAETTSGKLYVYCYDSQARLSFDKISISFSSKYDEKGNLIPDENNSFVERDLKLISASSSFRLTKWEVLGHTSDMSKSHIYTSRELIDNEKKDSHEGILACALQYIYDSDSNAVKTDVTNYITITDKVVAWQNLPSDNFTNYGDVKVGGTQPNIYPTYEGNMVLSGKIKQLHYVAFNTDNDPNMEKLTKIELQYKARNFYGKSKIVKDGTRNDLNDFTEINYKYEFDEGEKKIEDIKNPSNKEDENIFVKIIEPEDKEYVFTDHTLFFGQVYKWKINTLSTIEEIQKMNPEKILTNEDVDNKKWFVNFLENEFSVGRPKNIFQINSGDGTGIVGYDTNVLAGPFYFGISKAIYKDRTTDLDHIEYDTKISPIDVYDLSIMRLWYLYEGHVHEAIVVDTYTESKGTSNILDPHILTFEDWWNQVLGLFNKIFDFIKKYWKWILIGILGVILLPIIISLLTTVPGLFTGIVKVFKFLVKGIWFIISTPFKLIKWLFTRRKGE